MKTRATILSGSLFLLSTFSSWAQNEQLSNAGFESWQVKYDFAAPYEEPVDWYTLNPLTSVGYPATTIKTGDAYSGDSAVLLHTKAGPFSDLPGILTVQRMLDQNLNPQFDLNFIPFSSRPDSVVFYFKATPVAGDTNAMSFILTAWNSTSNSRDTVAEASWTNTVYVAGYTRASVPFNYALGQTPDSLFAIFSSSINGFFPVVGSMLYLDGIQLIYSSTSIGEKEKPGVKVYPNPARDRIYIETPYPVKQLKVYDFSGKLAAIIQEEEISEVDCSGWKAGTYILQFTGETGIQNKKLILSH